MFTGFEAAPTSRVELISDVGVSMEAVFLSSDRRCGREHILIWVHCF